MSKIPYQLDKIRAIVFDVDGVLSPSTIPVGDDGIPRRMANVKDGFSLVQAIRHGLKICIITGADTPGVRHRFEIIGIRPEDFFAGKMDKLPVLQAWMHENGLEPEEVAYVGDDLPDVAPMRFVGLPITPADGSFDTRQVALYITEAAGGHGVGREVIEEVMRARGIWPHEAEAF
ncbi:MAG: 3-deoxy-D-manno-octulosonate 8-phosphate phosphatase [Muribaculaceae bacterium]|nr:3-deoxy-D-manno-octulosonate 8-phosphate phosphatase [Muribaculaceae bacterium]